MPKWKERMGERRNKIVFLEGYGILRLLMWEETQMPEITVIVPVYNVEQYLRRCLDSILGQSFQDFELICVNDCSPDGSQAILNEYKNKYPQKIHVLVNETNQGLGKTRERGIEWARGKYITFIDSDDYIREDYLETYERKMRETDADMIVGGYIKDVNGKLTQHLVPDSIWSIVTYPIACAKLYKKSFLLEKQLHFSNIRCGEDIYFSMSLFYHRAVYCIMDYAGYYYYFNGNSITSSMNYEKNHEAFVAEIFREFLEKHDFGKLSRQEQAVIEYTYIANMVNALITYGRGGGIARMKEKYAFWRRDMEAKFPLYRKNPFVGICKPKGQTRKIRLGVGVTMGLQKLHMDKLLLYAISLM